MSPQPRRARNVAGKTTEAQHQRHVIALARFYGWRIFHAPAGGTGTRTAGTRRVDREQVGRGFPDLVLVRGARLIFAELKPEKGSQRVTKAVAEARPGWLAHRDLDDAQAEWLEALDATAAEVHLWRPSDLEDVAHVLAGGGMDPAAGITFARNLAPHGAPGAQTSQPTNTGAP